MRPQSLITKPEFREEKNSCTEIFFTPRPFLADVGRKTRHPARLCFSVVLYKNRHLLANLIYLLVANYESVYRCRCPAVGRWSVSISWFRQRRIAAAARREKSNFVADFGRELRGARRGTSCLRQRRQNRGASETTHAGRPYRPQM